MAMMPSAHQKLMLAGEGELQVAAEDALLDAADQQESDSPERCILEDLDSGERDGAEMEPASPGEGADEGGECSEARDQALNEMTRAPGAGEVEGQQVAAASLDEGHNGACRHHAQKRYQLTEKRLSGREMGLWVDEMEPEEDSSREAGHEEQDNEKEQHRPACSQALRSEQYPQQGTSFPGLGL